MHWRWVVLSVLGCAGLLGCGSAAVDSPAPTDLVSSDAPLAARAIPDALVSAGLISSAELRQLVLLADEPLGALFVTPGVPGPNDDITLFLVQSSKGVEPITAGMARYTADGWSSTRDLGGTPFATGGLRGVRFALPPRGSVGPLEAALRLSLGSTSFWLNAGGDNYRVDVMPEVKLQWVGNLRAHQEGLPRAFGGEPLYTGHSLTVEIDTFPQMPGVEPVLRWSTNGQASLKSAGMSLAQLRTGGYRNNSRWTATLPASALSGSALELWVEAKGPKNTLWDSRGGANYRGPRAASPAVEWAELGAYRFNKCRFVDGHCETGWFYGDGLANPFSATPGDYQVYAAAPSLAVELYVPGVTPVAPVEPQSTFVRAEVFSPFFSGDPAGAWKGYPMDFSETAGNNWRLKWDVREFRAPGMPAIGVDCPADGDYPFKIRLSSDGGKSWRWLGAAGLPTGGDNRTLRWRNVSAVPQLTVDGSTAFPGVPVGSNRNRTVYLVNTQNAPINVERLSLEDASGTFSLTAPACSSLNSCQVTLKGGERLALQLRFAPKAAGDVQAQVHAQLSDGSQSCGGRGDFPVTLSGSGS